MQYSVLVVDDEEEQRHAMMEKIDWEAAGFFLIGEAENGVEALEQVERLKPDLILTDIKMPLMTGLELAARVRQIRPMTQVMILSGYDSFEYAQAAIQHNIIRYLLKPISSTELSAELYNIRARMDEQFGEAGWAAPRDEKGLAQRLGVTEFFCCRCCWAVGRIPRRSPIYGKRRWSCS